MSNAKLVLKTSSACWIIGELVLSISGQVFEKRFLALHAFSECDTTSRTFGKGKGQLFKEEEHNTRYWNAIDVFYDSDADRDSIIAAGEVIFLTLFGANASIPPLLY